MLQGRINLQPNYCSQSKLKSFKNTNIKKEDRLLFESRSLPSFQLTSLLDSNNPITSDSTYTALYGVIRRWNQSLLQNPKLSNRRVQYFRNQHIYQTMKNILFQSYKLAKTHTQNLYKWYKNNSQEKQSSFNNQLTSVISSMKKRKQKIDQDRQIRDTYKSTLPFQIHQYQRKTLDPIIHKKNQIGLNTQAPKVSNNQSCGKAYSQKDFKSQNKSYMHDNFKDQYNHTQNKYYSHRNYQSQLMRKRQVQLVKETIVNWNAAKAKSKQHLTKNFNKSYFKTATLFFPKKQRSNQLPESFLKTQSAFYKIKKSNLNSSLGFKNFSTKSSFIEIKNIQTEQKSKLKSQIDLQEKKQSQSQACFDQFQKQNLPLLAKNINGIGLMTNPFDIKSFKGKKHK